MSRYHGYRDICRRTYACYKASVAGRLTPATALIRSSHTIPRACCACVGWVGSKPANLLAAIWLDGGCRLLLLDSCSSVTVITYSFSSPSTRSSCCQWQTKDTCHYILGSCVPAFGYCECHEV
jgi:hypothetical protein